MKSEEQHIQSRTSDTAVPLAVNAHHYEDSPWQGISQSYPVIKRYCQTLFWKTRRNVDDVIDFAGKFNSWNIRRQKKNK